MSFPISTDNVALTRPRRGRNFKDQLPRHNESGRPGHQAKEVNPADEETSGDREGYGGVGGTFLDFGRAGGVRLDNLGQSSVSGRGKGRRRGEGKWSWTWVSEEKSGELKSAPDWIRLHSIEHY